jgi:hypothetical protein
VPDELIISERQIIAGMPVNGERKISQRNNPRRERKLDLAVAIGIGRGAGDERGVEGGRVNRFRLGGADGKMRCETDL